MLYLVALSMLMFNNYRILAIIWAGLLHMEFFYFYIICGPSVGGFFVVVLSLFRFDNLKARSS